MGAPYRVLSLFAGIGGFDLGLERTGGFKTVAFCEIDPFCQKVLAKHWPGVPCYHDVRTLTAEQLARDEIRVDVVCGGFPCQDVSLAGRRAGMGDTRSGLWEEYRRLVCELRPRFVIVENTPGLLSLGMGTVLGDLAALGYDGQWDCIPACYVGADHLRDRVWLVAYSADWKHVDERRSPAAQDQVEQNAADAMRAGLSRRGDSGTNGKDEGGVRARPRFTFSTAPAFPREYRQHKPVLGRGVHGVPNRVDRIAALGNAVVPQIPELIGRAILASVNQSPSSPSPLHTGRE